MAKKRAVKRKAVKKKAARKMVSCACCGAMYPKGSKHECC